MRSGISYDVALRFVLILAAGVGLLFCFLILQREIITLRTAYAKRRDAALTPWIHRGLTGGGAGPAVLHLKRALWRSDRRVVRDVLLRLALDLPLVQVVEYLRGFLFGRMGWSAINGLLIISGAFGLFDKRAAVLAGGYADDTVGEDMELVVRMHRRLREAGIPCRVRFVPDPVCWTEAPESLRVLRRQRNRWHRGLIDTLWRHRGMFGRPRFGVVGLLSMPTFVIFEMLGPLVELSGYVIVPLCYLFGLLDTAFMLIFLTLAVLYGILLSVSAVLLEDMAFRRYPRIRDLALLVLVGIVENLGYRQATAWWRTRAFWDYWRGDLGWGRMERRGIAGTKAGGGRAA